MTKARTERPDYLRVLDDPRPTPQLDLLSVAPAPIDDPQRTTGLDEQELSIWDELLRGAPSNVVRELNHVVFETLVRATREYRDAAGKVKQYGAVIKSPSGYPIQSPYVSIMNKQAQLIARASSELGLTLASRMRAKAGSRSQPKSNPFEGLKALDE